MAAAAAAAAVVAVVVVVVVTLIHGAFENKKSHERRALGKQMCL